MIELFGNKVKLSRFQYITGKQYKQNELFEAKRMSLLTLPNCAIVKCPS